MSTRLLKAFGVVIALIGGWAAIVAYAGPTFGYPMPPGSDQSAWDWSASHTWRHLLPGLAAILGGGLLFYAGRRALAALGALVAFAAGAWMILSPFVVRAWLDTGGGGGGDASTTMQIITPLGYHHVPGILTIGLASFALGGLFVRRREPPRDVPDRRTDEETRFEREPAGARM